MWNLYFILVKKCESNKELLDKNVVLGFNKIVDLVVFGDEL